MSVKITLSANQVAFLNHAADVYETMFNHPSSRTEMVLLFRKMHKGVNVLSGHDVFVLTYHLTMFGRNGGGVYANAVMSKRGYVVSVNAMIDNLHDNVFLAL